MDFINKSKKNIKKYDSSFKKKNKSTLSLKEVTGGSVAGFVGKKGMGIDALFAGPFHPDSGHGSENEKLLKQQLKNRREKRKDLTSDEDDVIDDYSGIPDPVGGYYDTETEYYELAFDELMAKNDDNIQFSRDMTPVAETEWKSVGWEYDYDENEKPSDRVLKYDDNSYNNPIVRKIEYDDNSNLYADDTYINKSKTNWKIINNRR